MRSCGDRIVEVEGISKKDIDEAVKVKDFVQLLKLSEETLSAINCYVDEENELAYFMVSKYEKNYLYILK